MAIRKESIQRLCGSLEIFNELEKENNLENIWKYYNSGISDFKELRKRFLIYH